MKRSPMSMSLQYGYSHVRISIVGIILTCISIVGIILTCISIVGIILTCISIVGSILTCISIVGSILTCISIVGSILTCISIVGIILTCKCKPTFVRQCSTLLVSHKYVSVTITVHVLLHSFCCRNCFPSLHAVLVLYTYCTCVRMYAYTEELQWGIVNNSWTSLSARQSVNADISADNP